MDTPDNLLPDLAIYGIEAPERGICEDTAENRRTLRKNGLTWQVIYNEDGTLSDNILAISPAMMEARGATFFETKASLLTDPYDRESDYVTGLDLILLPNVADLVPAWVLSGTKYYDRLEIQRENTGKDIEPILTGPPARCLYTKNDGHRCLLWHNGRNSYGMCRLHLQTVKKNNETPGMMVERARIRVKQASIHAMDYLEDLAENAESEPVRLGAINSILDRAGLRGGIEVDSTIHVDIKPAEVVLRERLARLQEVADAQRLAIEANTEDAEVIEDDAE